MTTLKEEIQSLRCESSDRRSSFVPEGALEKIITIEKIKSALRSAKAQLDREQETLELIAKGGKKTFAILVSIYRAERIVGFIETDQLQRSKIDSKLPYGSRADLGRILPKADAADFFEKQWEFTAPIFRRRAGHRCLHERTIFPFLESSVQGEGNFGNIYKVELHHSHSLGAFQAQKRPVRSFSVLISLKIDRIAHSSQDLTVARKELKVKHPSDSEDFKRECRVLSFLNCLDHPNIIELQGTYTHNGIHSLIFPLAEYDLSKLLQSQPPSNFTSELDYVFALCGLASALDKLHAFCSDDLDIKLIGCHHDLRPHNILVKDGKLLLADFGLSNLKEISEGSRTPWKTGDSRYLAPECEDADKNFLPGMVGRKSDIWSFGCVLAELVTYIVHGPDRLKAFEESRKVVLAERLTVHSFHAGRSPNKGVETWLTALDKTATPVCKDLIRLVRDMLQIEPDDRPNANQVTHRLRFAALKCIFNTVDSTLNSIILEESDGVGLISFRKAQKVQTYKNLDMVTERERMFLWAQTVGLMSSAWERSDIEILLTADEPFHRSFHNLKRIEHEVSSSTGPQSDVLARVVKLRMINDDMIYALPAKLHGTINHLLEQRLLSTDDLGVLEHVRRTFDENSQYRSIGTLAAVRYMHRLCEAPVDGHGKRMQLKGVSWKPQKSFDHFAIGELDAEGRPATQALVENIKYAEHWVNAVGDELYSRIGAVAELLRTTSRSDKKMRLLSPIGYFHEPHKRAFKLAFHIPGLSEVRKDEVPEIKTLRQYIQARTSPALEDRFLLARRLASTLSRLHKVKWVSKSISAFSIIFSLPPSQQITSNIPPPYLIGFNYSRPNDPKSISEIPEYRMEVTDYCHPEYSKDIRVRYQTRFDWYSLGLVLLEIGLWRTLGSMTKEKQALPPDELLEHILQKYVPKLDFYTGREYRKIVTRCLKGEIGTESPEEGVNGAGPGKFEFTQTVEEQLASCSLGY